MKVLWSPLAELRALEAVDAIAADRPRAAAAWLDELLDRVASLSRLAKRGRVVPEIGKAAYREIFHHPYRVVYRADATQVVVLTIRHTRRAWDPPEVSRGASRRLAGMPVGARVSHRRRFRDERCCHEGSRVTGMNYTTWRQFPYEDRADPVIATLFRA